MSEAIQSALDTGVADIVLLLGTMTAAGLVVFSAKRITRRFARWLSGKV